MAMPTSAAPLSLPSSKHASPHPIRSLRLLLLLLLLAPVSAGAVPHATEGRLSVEASLVPRTLNRTARLREKLATFYKLHTRLEKPDLDGMARWYTEAETEADLNRHLKAEFGADLSSLELSATLGTNLYDSGDPSIIKREMESIVNDARTQKHIIELRNYSSKIDNAYDPPAKRPSEWIKKLHVQTRSESESPAETENEEEEEEEEVDPGQEEGEDDERVFFRMFQMESLKRLREMRQGSEEMFARHRLHKPACAHPPLREERLWQNQRYTRPFCLTLGTNGTLASRIVNIPLEYLAGTSMSARVGGECSVEFVTRLLRKSDPSREYVNLDPPRRDPPPSIWELLRRKKADEGRVSEGESDLERSRADGTLDPKVGCSWHQILPPAWRTQMPTRDLARIHIFQCLRELASKKQSSEASDFIAKVHMAAQMERHLFRRCRRDVSCPAYRNMLNTIGWISKRKKHGRLVLEMLNIRKSDTTSQLLNAWWRMVAPREELLKWHILSNSAGRAF